MCGRTSCHLPKDVLARACAYRDRQGRQRLPEWKDPDKYCPSYNKSPQSSSPVLLSRLHFEKVSAGVCAGPASGLTGDAHPLGLGLARAQPLRTGSDPTAENHFRPHCKEKFDQHFLILEDEVLFFGLVGMRAKFI